MPEETESDLKESASPLYSDYERFGNLLADAQNLAKENRKFNPAIFRDYFVILAEVQRFVYPMFRGSEKMNGITEDVKTLDKITSSAYRKLLNEKDYKVPVQIFEALSGLHQDLLVLKQDANLGIRLRERVTDRKRLGNVLE